MCVTFRDRLQISLPILSELKTERSSHSKYLGRCYEDSGTTPVVHLVVDL